MKISANCVDQLSFGQKVYDQKTPNMDNLFTDDKLTGFYIRKFKKITFLRFYAQWYQEPVV